MNYKQNEKIEQVTDVTLVVGVDIGSETHFARAFDNRNREVTKRVFKFNSNLNGFISFQLWVEEICRRAGKSEVLIGCEPTGHYWYTFEKFTREHGMKMVFVNPFSVKRMKELDDNSPRKTDHKDPKTIAKLVVDGRYCYPYVPDGIYSDLREVVSSRDRIQKELNAAANRIQRWLKIYFPEYQSVYRKFDAQSGVHVLEKAPLPEDIIGLGAEGINKIWREKKMRAVGMKRAATLVEAAHNSVGIHGGAGARCELRLLLEDYRAKQIQMEKVTQSMTEVVMKVPHVEKLLAIKGVGIVTVAGFLAEIGDIGRFESPKQIQKYAGLELVENSSGKHKGRTTISKRGRRKLRRVLFQVVLPLMGQNPEFREVYDYYSTRIHNPLKGNQAMIAVSCKLIRVFFAILKNGVEYNAEKLRKDIRRPETAVA